ncbi:rCG63599 [Rattus norvegicus]|uniref:RCG63599 n=1 Tax=Rattus norvegicus TaxID=10116 RepID=A6JL53_RAT|nr:rCG63599 [Rattus norvegicus]
MLSTSWVILTTTLSKLTITLWVYVALTSGLLPLSKLFLRIYFFPTF